MDDLELTDDVADRFWSKIERAPNGCWNWTGWVNQSGHPRFDIGPRKVLATHVALTLAGKPRPSAPNNYALHGDNCTPRCCNPDHVRWGSAKENAEDRDRLGRRIATRGEAHGNSKITDGVVAAIRQSNLTCVELAERFGLSRVWVGKIKRRQVWTHLP